MTGRWRSVALVLLGALTALAGQRILGGSPGAEGGLEGLAARQDSQVVELAGLAERRAQAAQEMALAQFYRLQEFRQLGTEGQGLVYLVPVDDSEDPLAAAAGGAAVRLPRVAVDPGARQLWSRAATRLRTLEANVDPRVFEAFEAVAAFAEAHPWPASDGLAAVRRSDWSRPDVVETWLTLNRTLVSRIDGLLAGF